MVEVEMAFEYRSLKVLEVLARKQRAVGVEELRTDLARHGFRFPVGGLDGILRGLREEGFVQALVLAGVAEEVLASVAITAKGERKVRGIVHF